MNNIHKHLQHFFTPRESNNYKAKVLHLDFLTVYLILALIFSVMVKQIKTGAVLGFATDISISRVYELTNEARVKNNLPPLNFNEKLSAAASKKAENMFASNYWAHFAPDGTTPWSYILDSGYQYSVAGENLAKGFYFSDAVVQAWMDSPTHRANILRDSYQDVGYAIANGTLNGEETTLVVQMFGTQLSAPVAEKRDDAIAGVPTSMPVQVTTAPADSKATKDVVRTYFKPESSVLAKNTAQSTPKFNIFPIFFNFNTLFLAALAFVLLLDFYHTKRMGVTRIGGKNIAHFIFIGFMFLGIYIISVGGIIQ